MRALEKVKPWIVPCLLVWAGFYAQHHVDFLGANELSRAWDRTHPDPYAEPPLAVYLASYLELMVWLAPAALWVFWPELDREHRRTGAPIPWVPLVGYYAAGLPMVMLAYVLTTGLVLAIVEFLFGSRWEARFSDLFGWGG